MSIRFFTAVIILGWSVTVAMAKEWEGIVPLKSTRSNVERRLGRNETSSVVSYRLKGKKVLIWYSTGPCNSSRETEWNVPKDTVTSIHIFSFKSVRLSSLSLALRKFEKIRGDADLPDHFYYINREEGFGIGIENLHDGNGEVVTEYVYGPTSQDSSLKCKKSMDK